MRLDYSLYVPALICFIIAGIFLSGGVAIEQNMSQIAIAIFAILGVLFVVGGYTLRPKVAVTAATAPPSLPAEPSPVAPPPPLEEKVEEAPVAPSSIEEQVPPVPHTPPPVEEAPAPAPIVEEPAKVEEEKPAEKPVRRRRRKKAA